MKKWQKATLVFLSFSNVIVLGAVFYTYFNNKSHTAKFFSVSNNQEKLKRQVKKECDRKFKELTSGKRNSFSCYITIKKKYKNTKYKIKTLIKAIKKTDGQIEITSKGQISKKNKFTIEADFCKLCENRKRNTENNLEDIMKTVIAMAEKIHQEAEKSIRESEEKYQEKQQQQTINQKKEKQCKGEWNINKEEFIEFDLEEKLNCRIKQISLLNLPLDIESFYHSHFKKDLWEIALSDEDYLLEDVLDTFNNPYRYSFSVQSSTNLIKSYLNWKEDYALQTNLKDKKKFVENIKSNIEQMASFMTKQQSQSDLFYLNKAFDNQLIFKPEISIKEIDSTDFNSTINYDEIKKNVKDLY